MRSPRHSRRPTADYIPDRNHEMRLETLDSPGPDEYAAFYSGYVSLLRGRDALGVLRRQSATLRAGLQGMTDAEALHRYAPGKWSVKEVIGHLTDAERVFSYRLLRIARGDATPLAGFDEKPYVEAAESDRLPLGSLLDDFEAARISTLRLIDSIPPDGWTRRGIAADVPVSARGQVFIIAGHVEHHLAILRDRYGVG